MIVVGAQYYRPPNPPREDWDRDLGRMRAAGLDTVKLWACWSWMQPTPDAVDFADLDELMDLAAKHRLGVVVNTILENAPYWLEQRRPDAHYLDQEDRPVRLTAAMNTPGGGWPGLCNDDPEVWAAAASFLGTVAGRYRDHPALRVWDVWNEPHLEPASYFPDRVYCYCPASLERFRAWLTARYSTVDALNAAWRRRYSDWAQVGPPRVFEAVPDMLDWREFWFDNLAGWLDRRVAVVREADPGHVVMTHVALSGFTGQLATHTLDEYTLTGPVDAFGTSSFPTWLMADDPVEHLFNLDTARGAAAGKPFWQAELQGGRGRRNAGLSTPHPAPDTVGLWMWNALAAGATGIVFWQWRPELLGPESPGYGLCAPDGTTTARVDAVTALATVARHPAVAASAPSPGSVGLLVSRRSALHAFATDRDMALYRDAVLGAYRALVDTDLPVEVLHDELVAERGVPAHIEALYWPMPATSIGALAAALAGFVARGGRLVAEAAPGEYDEHGARRPSVPGAGLDALFGVRQVDADIVDTVTLPSGLSGRWQRETLKLDGAECVEAFPDGTPAVTRRGTAVLIATYPSLAYAARPDAPSRAALVELIGAPARELVWADPGPGRYSRARVRPDGRRVIVAVNWTGTPQKATLAEALVPPGEDEPVTTVVVPARSGMALLDP
ncbi:beta-galactosidase [Phytohabitans houttuyneae]|uniref:Beta-galactosidase n=1 Tax=Phytohabitans houttuyneae TaxID=1076126 RepID=A0A6V8KC84_9ACTN|nr:beta-galactosidase [Phytohabitans houttuyneae]GFJ79606.1 beta-galactosidase [Phytohabitans houttuyneae]